MSDQLPLRPRRGSARCRRACPSLPAARAGPADRGRAGAMVIASGPRADTSATSARRMLSTSEGRKYPSCIKTTARAAAS
eukprot:7583191-Pyramimonas_sp.AAC.1